VDGTRSPKSLSALATDAVCRSLVYLDGALPPGLPPDVVADIAQSLDQHGAWNRTTLAAFQTCELLTLNLTSSRGVSDDWIQALTGPLATDSVRCGQINNTAADLSSVVAEDCMDVEMDDGKSKDRKNRGAHLSPDDDASSQSTTSFVTAKSDHYAVAAELSEECQKAMLTNSIFVDQSSNPEGMIIARDESYDRHSIPDQDAFRLPALPCGSVSTRTITHLDLSGSQYLTDRGLAKMNNLQQLEEARLEHCHSIVGQGLVIFSASHHLRILSLAHCRRLTDESIAHLSHLMALEYLSLAGCRCLTDRSLAALADLYSLRHLDLSQCDLLTDTGVEQLESLEALENLSFGWCRLITDDGLRCFSDQPCRATVLRRLCLARCSISDDGVGYLARLLALEELNLNGCIGVGSTALGNAMQRLKHLAVLDVSHCPGIL
jgi:hypothetical protein